VWREAESRTLRLLGRVDHDLGIVTGSQRRGVRYSIMARRPDPQLLPITLAVRLFGSSEQSLTTP
jgi:hypothetical protein